MKEIRRNRWLTPLAAALNVAALGVIVSTYLEIDELDETWSDAASLELGEAALLTELERSLGYSGFIHHFKNYVLRREFMPYIGVNWTKKFANTADFARDEGEESSDVQFVLGFRAWF